MTSPPAHRFDDDPLIRLLRLVLPFKWGMALAVLLGLLTIVSNVGLMATSAWLISIAAISDTIAAFGVSVVGVRFFGIARGVFRYLERLVSHDVTFKLLQELRIWFYKVIEPLAPAGLSEHRSGDLLGRAVADVETLQEFYIRVIAPTLVAISAVLLMGIFTAAYNPLITLTLFFFFALAGLGLPYLILQLSEAVGAQFVASRAQLTATLVDSIQGLPDLLANGAEQRQIAAVQQASNQFDDAQLKFVKIEALQLALGSLISNIAMWAVIIVAFPLVQGVNLATLALGAFASFEALLPLSVMVRYLSSTRGAANRVYELADQEVIVPVTGEKPSSDSRGSTSLDIQGLQFSYQGGTNNVLEDVSFSLKEGEHLAVVGSSGVGKSTLHRLLLKFWPVSPNMIELNGQDIAFAEPEWVRKQFAVVPQSTYLFNDTIRRNLLLANPQASEARLLQALELAQLHSFVEKLEHGLDTRIGEQGVRLSGGERQRLALARAWLKDAPFVLLDEPTANLDAVTERDIMRTVSTALRSRSVLLITHRLVHLVSFDQIIVLEQGRIQERGTHAKLMSRKGIYADLYKRQSTDLQQLAIQPTT